MVGYQQHLHRSGIVLDGSVLVRCRITVEDGDSFNRRGDQASQNVSKRDETPRFIEGR